ncbi:aminoacyl-tRNA hydrolase [soil metagenome]
MHLIVGLGNPGPKYARTRHNAGFFVLDTVAERRGATFGKGKRAEEARVDDLILAKPTTFMNLSGLAVQGLMARHGIRPEEVVIVHDDLDLPLGRVRVKRGGGAAGQRGVQDVMERVGPAFVRVRIGIGRPPPAWAVERWVLSRFGDDEQELLVRVVAAGADAVDLIAASGLDAAMNVINGLDLARPAEPPGDEVRVDEAPLGDAP